MSKDFDEFLAYVSANINSFTEEECQQVQESIAQIQQMEKIEKARTNFKTFVELCGEKILKFSSCGQHDEVADAFERLVDGDLKRLTISMPPRFGKSSFGSICLPAWYLGKYPGNKVIQASAIDERATEFGRRVKEIIDSDLFRRIFPGVYLTKDSKSKGRFATNHGGTYYALGIGAGVAGIGADLFVCDDIVDEQDAKAGKVEAFEKAWEWFLTGPMQRLQPGGRILQIATRWSKADPIGQVKRRMSEDKKADQYVSIEVCALDSNEESTFPEVWSTKELTNKKTQFSLSGRMDLWEAQYQQSPVLMEGSIVKTSSWRVWDKNVPVKDTDEVEFVPPECKYILMSWDVSYTKSNRADPSAMVLLGVFEHKDQDKNEEFDAVILLHAEEMKLEYPELRKKVKDLQEEFEVDCCLVEDKGAGSVLLQDLRRSGISCTPAKIKGVEDKITRLNSVADLFTSGMVFYIPTAQNKKVLAQVNDFPAVEHDDLTDALAHGLRYLKKGSRIITPMDKRSGIEDSYTPPENGYY